MSNTKETTETISHASISGIRQSAFIAYHWMKYFFQWIRLYQKHIMTTFKAVIWAYRHGIRLPIKERLNMYKWNSWKRHKESHMYIFKKGNQMFLIQGEYFNELMIGHFA